MKSEEKTVEKVMQQSHPFVFKVNNNLLVPDYLRETYWWAYLHPRGVKFFDHIFIINCILFGNYKKLMDSVLDELDINTGNVLQMAAVYGNISSNIAEKISDANCLDVVDVAAIQLQNLSRKVSRCSNVRLIHQDSTALNLEAESYGCILVFFLLHEVPDYKKSNVLQQAIKMVKPGGQIIIVDYHRPRAFSPMRYLLYPVLKLLEPFALSLWKREIISWLPKQFVARKITRCTYFWGLYQKVIIVL